MMSDLSDFSSVSDSDFVTVSDLDNGAQSDTDENDAGSVCEAVEPQIARGTQPYLFEPDYEVNEQVLEPPVQQDDLALLQNMDW